MARPKKQNTCLDLSAATVVKANDLIQKSRFKLTLQQQKIVLFLISQISPSDEDFKLYDFSLSDFCRVCGITARSGKNYADLKAAIKEIADKSVWITLDNGKHTLIRWIEKPYFDEENGRIQIKLDQDMKPYLLQLKDNFTQYELAWTLNFKSKYTIRLYELIKSIHFHETEAFEREYDLAELQQLVDAESYKTYQTFKTRVLEPAIEEINNYSEKTLRYEPIKQGRSVTRIRLVVETKDIIQRLELRSKIDAKETSTE